MEFEKIEYETISVRELTKFAESIAKRSTEERGLLPITPWRAAAQSLNPCAASGDPALLVAWYKSKVIGYLGNMPCILRRPDGNHKVHFLSTFLTSDKARRTGLGKKIITKMFENEYDFVLTGVSASAEGLYRKLSLPLLGSYEAIIVPIAEYSLVFRGFRKMAHMTGLLCFRKMLKKSARRTMWAVKFPEMGQDWQNYAYKCLASALEGKRFVRTSGFGENTLKMIDERNATNVFLKDSLTLKWVLENPWILNRQNADSKISSEYHFSSVFDDYQYYIYEIYEGLHLFGFVIFLSVIDAEQCTLKLIDYELQDRLAAEVCFAETIRSLAGTVILPESVYAHLRHRRPFRICEKVRRVYYCRPASRTKLFGAGYNTIRFKPADGDQFVVTSS